jgi:2-amino-4-hydroxy-6-hydroxymethyldihydropteridine diphosphokinase
MARAGIALGSNLGDRLANIRAAIGFLREIATPGEPFLTAPIYQTEPRFCPPESPDFYNTVVEMDFAGSASGLLEQTQAAELKLGRVRGPERNTPRTIDIDLLYLGNCQSSNDTLDLPHPRIGERSFVLRPLADIRPDLVLTGQCRTIAEMLANLESDETPLQAVAERTGGPHRASKSRSSASNA